jgi:hypothetical protein
MVISTASNYPFREVVGFEDLSNMYCRSGEGSRRHFLRCGHDIVTKQSAGFPKRKRCRECAHASISGGRD